MITSKMQSKLINKYEFYYTIDGNGEPLLFVHGSNSDSRTWEQQISSFAKHFKTINYSRRFHVPNERIAPGQDYAMNTQVEDLKQIMNDFGKPVHLVAHSYGALLALELASTNPELIKKMVLIEPPAIRLFVSYVPKPKEIIKLLFSEPATAISIIRLGVFGLGPATKEAAKGNLEKAVEFFGKAILGKDAYNKMPVARKRQAVENLSATELTGSGFLPIHREQLKKLKSNTLFILGEQSHKAFHHLTKHLMDLIPNSSKIIISKASHLVHEDNHIDFNKIVMEFLNTKD